MDKNKLKRLYEYRSSIEAFEDEWNGTTPKEIEALVIEHEDWVLNAGKEDPKQLVLPGDFKNEKQRLLGHEAYEAYSKALTIYTSKWKSYDHLAFESVALMKAYELRGKSFAFIFTSVKNALHNEVDSQARRRSHEFVVEDDNYDKANKTINEIDRMIADVYKSAPEERPYMEDELRDTAATRFHPGQVSEVDADYEFTEWQQVRESLVMYLAFAPGLPLALRLEMEALFTRLSLKEKTSLMAYANRKNNRSDEKTVERLAKAYLSSLSSFDS